MIHVARRRLKINGTMYVPGDTITSEQIGNAQLERQLHSLGRIKPVKAPDAHVAQTPVDTPESPVPSRNKGGRPRRLA